MGSTYEYLNLSLDSPCGRDIFQCKRSCDSEIVSHRYVSKCSVHLQCILTLGYPILICDFSTQKQCSPFSYGIPYPELFENNNSNDSILLKNNLQKTMDGPYSPPPRRS